MRRIGAALIVLFVASCAYVNNSLDRVEEGMTRDQVARAVGHPDKTKAEIINRHGQKVVIWEYANQRDDGEPYLFYFVEGKLALWGTSPNWHDLANQLASPPGH